MKAWLAPILLAVSLSAVAQSNYTSGNTTVDNLSNNQQGTNVANNSNNQSTTNSTTYNGNAPGSTPPPSAISPAFMSGGNDSCLIGYGGSVSSSVIGISAGSYKRDPQCELLKLAKTLNEFGLKIAAVAVLCQDARVFEAMAMAGTPCPYLGTIGKQATLGWQQNPQRRPDYDANKELKPISQSAASAGDDGTSLSDRFRASKRSNAANQQPTTGSDQSGKQQ